MLTPGLLRNINIDATLKSHPRTGNRGGPTTTVALKVSPVSNVDPLLAQRAQLDTPVHARQVFTVTDIVIIAGMYLESVGKEYAIKGVAPWPMRDGSTLYQLILEEFISR